MLSEEFDFTDASMLRKKAEEKLLGLKKSSIEPVLEADLKKLLHELQVHQIELEMQNQELAQAYEKTEMTLQKYTQLHDLAPIGFFILEFDGSICDLNFTGADLLRNRRFSLLGSNFKLFIAKDSLMEFNLFFDQIFTGNTKVSCEINLGYDGNFLCNVYMEGVVTGDDRKCLLSVINRSMLIT